MRFSLRSSSPIRTAMSSCPPFFALRSSERQSPAPAVRWQGLTGAEPRPVRTTATVPRSRPQTVAAAVQALRPSTSRRAAATCQSGVDAADHEVRYADASDYELRQTQPAGLAPSRGRSPAPRQPGRPPPDAEVHRSQRT